MNRRFAANRTSINKSAWAKVLAGSVFWVSIGAGAQDLSLMCGKNGELISIVRPSDRAHGEDGGSGCQAGGSCGKGGRSSWDVLPAGFKAVVDDSLASVEKWFADEPIGKKGQKAAALRKVKKAQCTLPQCRKPAVAPAPLAGQIKLEYPFSGPNSDKSGIYDRKTLETTVRHALATGVDPYLALAILLLENPPSNMEKFAPYAVRKGVIPVDQFAAFDQLGCLETGAAPDRFPNLADQEVKQYRLVHSDFAKAEAEYKKQVEGNLVVKQLHAARQELAALKEQFADYEKAHRPGAVGRLLAAVKSKVKGAPVSADPKSVKMKAEIEKAQQKVASLLRNGGEAAEKVRSNYLSANEAETRFRTEIFKKKGDKGALALEELSCAGEPKKCYMLIQPQKKVPSLDLSFLDAEDGRSSDNKSELLCADARRVDVGREPLFLKERGNRDCCVNVSYPADLKSGLAMQIKTRLGADFLKEQIQQCVANRKGVETLTFCLQKFHGLGGFGTTEAVKNDCLAGMYMADRPLYGARAADLMVNLFMGNPEIRALVENIRQVEDKPVVSIFCLKSGPSPEPFLLQDHWFLNEQKEYLLRGAQWGHAKKDSSSTLGALGAPDARAFKMQFDSAAGSKFRSPANESELKKYLEVERDRAESCKKTYWDKKAAR